jgi:hypothetical protein
LHGACVNMYSSCMVLCPAQPNCCTAAAAAGDQDLLKQHRQSSETTRQFWVIAVSTWNLQKETQTDAQHMGCMYRYPANRTTHMGCEPSTRCGIKLKQRQACHVSICVQAHMHTYMHDHQHTGLVCKPWHKVGTKHSTPLWADAADPNQHEARTSFAANTSFATNHLLPHAPPYKVEER